MAIQTSPLPWLMLISFACSILVISCHGTSDDRKAPLINLLNQVHIVYMGDLPKGEFSAETLHNSMLQEVVGSGAPDILLHSYQRSFNRFAAKLTKEEAEKPAGMEWVVSVFLSQKKKLHTTRSWDFIGFSHHSRRATLESDIIIGMLDTRIWPESESFSDKEFGPPPKKWMGTCQKSSNFTCNNKIIGARYYRAGGNYRSEDFQSARDSEGHGSHTASVDAGGTVNKASLFGFRSGTARGGVPSARIAVYKICWYDGCTDEDILAALDDAIADGVDIISLSVGGIFALDYFRNSIAIGAFHSTKHGILTSNSAGNGGPSYASVINLSPWNCWEGTLDETLIKGKIVLCDYLDYMEGPLNAGAVGVVIQDDGFKDFAYSFPLPVSNLDLTDGSDVLHYLNTTKKPTATIFRSTKEKDELAPYVVSFSSRGPNIISFDILKPDITATGVDILAAWSIKHAWLEDQTKSI
ncbi:hypothetical protein CRYUN_Cryun05aG0155400 [Craigia yunnanensis]